MKFATWNVNGIRARASQLHEWMERERPDVVCLQELKAELTQVPEILRRQEYHAFWHCCKGILRCVAPAEQGQLPHGASLPPSAVRSGVAGGHRGAGQPGDCVDVRPQWRERLSRQDRLPEAD